jgi:hypothetical protein
MRASLANEDHSRCGGLAREVLSRSIKTTTSFHITSCVIVMKAASFADRSSLSKRACRTGVFTNPRPSEPPCDTDSKDTDALSDRARCHTSLRLSISIPRASETNVAAQITYRLGTV